MTDTAMTLQARGVLLQTVGLRDGLAEQRQQLLAYLGSKMKAGDWHAVADAAMDLREIDAKLALLVELSHDAD